MNITALLLTMLAFGALNRVRGSGIFGTTVSRLVCSAGEALLIAILGDDLLLFFPAFSFIFLWCVFAWDNYWGAAIGSIFHPDKATFWPADQLLKHSRFFTRVYDGWAPAWLTRAWGTVGLGLRSFIPIFPVFLFLALVGYWFAIFTVFGTLLYGVPYLLIGLKQRKSYVIAMAEAVGGAYMGLLFFITLTI
jgi:hypothetical protein